MTSFWMPLGTAVSSGSAQPFTSPPDALIFLAASRNSVRVVGHLGHAGLGEQVLVDEERVDEVDHRDHVRLALDLHLAGELAGVVVRVGHQLGQVGDRALLGEVVDPGAVETDDVGQGLGGGAR
jgi:hypothetical protein